MKRYRVVAIDDAHEGMRMYEDLCDRAGNMLLPKSTVLTASMINSLRRRGIEVVRVMDDSVTVTPEQLAAESARVMARIAHLCRHSGNGRANQLLRSVVEQYRTGELG